MWNCLGSTSNLVDFFQDFSLAHSVVSLRERMTQYGFRILAAATIICSSILASGTFRAGGRQFVMPQALDAKHPITYFIADGSGKLGYHSSDRELARWA